MSARHDPGAARRWMLAGAFLYPPVAAALIIAGLGELDGLFTALLLVGLPALGAAQSRLLPDEAVERLPVYASSGFTILVLGGAALALGARLDGGAAALGLVPVSVPVAAAWVAGLVTGALALVTGSLALGRRLDLPESPVVADLMPRSGAEKAAFTGLSLVAGVGEELAYRGYLVAVLGPLVGPWGAVLLGSAAFSLLHGYQGRIGVVRTGLLGAALGASLLLSGSLWPAVVGHALIDVVLGVVLGERLLVRAEGSR